MGAGQQGAVGTVAKQTVCLLKGNQMQRKGGGTTKYAKHNIPAG